MRLHRFYINPKDVELEHIFWLRDNRLLNQWTKVLRYQKGSEVVLFDGEKHERLYKIIQIEPSALQLELITEFERKLPKSHIYLFFSLLKKDKNEWVLQKCTELGVRNFVPILADRSEKTGFNIERAEKIIIEAAEQCGRSDIPQVREPLSLQTALDEYKDKIQLFVCDETLDKNENTGDEPIGIFIGPEGGWTNDEIVEFEQINAGHLHLGNLTLRAETAAVAATTKLIQ
jgi:16S rRNA (uracil1498-N3)-methyltransferase